MDSEHHKNRRIRTCLGDELVDKRRPHSEVPHSAVQRRRNGKQFNVNTEQCCHGVKQFDRITIELGFGVADGRLCDSTTVSQCWNDCVTPYAHLIMPRTTLSSRLPPYYERKFLKLEHPRLYVFISNKSGTGNIYTYVDIYTCLYSSLYTTICLLNMMVFEYNNQAFYFRREVVFVTWFAVKYFNFAATYKNCFECF